MSIVIYPPTPSTSHTFSFSSLSPYPHFLLVIFGTLYAFILIESWNAVVFPNHHLDMLLKEIEVKANKSSAVLFFQMKEISHVGDLQTLGNSNNNEGDIHGYTRCYNALLCIDLHSSHGYSK